MCSTVLERSEGKACGIGSLWPRGKGRLHAVCVKVNGSKHVDVHTSTIAVNIRY